MLPNSSFAGFSFSFAGVAAFAGSIDAGRGGGNGGSVAAANAGQPTISAMIRRRMRRN
jgi:hypothetical protein